MKTIFFYNFKYFRFHKDCLKNNDASELRLGKSCYFTKEQEKEVVKHCLKMAKLFYGLSSKELWKLVYDYAEKIKFVTELIATKTWLKKTGFLIS